MIDYEASRPAFESKYRTPCERRENGEYVEPIHQTGWEHWCRALEYAAQQPEPQSAVEWVRERRQELLNGGRQWIWIEDALELARRCDEAERERDLCKLTLERMPSDTDSNPLQLPEPQSAVEWVKHRFCRHDELSPLVLMYDDALDLARRCDLLTQNNEDAQKLVHEYHDANEGLRDQLAAAQARADEAEKPGWQQACMSIGVILAPLTKADGIVDAVREIVAQLAAAQAEARELREALETLLDAVAEMKHDSTNGDYELPTLAKLDFASVLKAASEARAALAKHAKEGGR